MSEQSGDPRSRGRHRARLIEEGRGVNRLLAAGVLALAGLALVLLGAGPASGHVAGQVIAGQSSDTKLITVKAGSLSDHGCNDSEWHFIINQIDTASDAPATIHVTWANGQSADVPLEKVTGERLITRPLSTWTAQSSPRPPRSTAGGLVSSS